LLLAGSLGATNASIAIADVHSACVFGNIKQHERASLALSCCLMFADADAD
jgi:hypothetical protein